MISEIRKYLDGLALFALSLFAVCTAKVEAQVEQRNSNINFQMKIEDPNLILGEPILMQARWQNTGSDPVTIRLPTMYGSTGINFKKKGEDRFKNLSIFLGEFETSGAFHSSSDIVLKPGEFIEDEGVFAFFGIKSGFEPGKFILRATNYENISNEVEISVAPPDDDELFESFSDDKILSAIQGWRPEPGAIELLRNVSEADSKSRYVNIAKLYLDRVVEKRDRSKMTGAHYLDPAYQANMAATRVAALDGIQETEVSPEPNLIGKVQENVPEEKEAPGDNSEGKSIVWLLILVASVFLAGGVLYFMRRNSS